MTVHRLCRWIGSTESSGENAELAGLMLHWTCVKLTVIAVRAGFRLSKQNLESGRWL